MMEFTFEASPWEQALDGLQPGDTLSAVRFLTLVEGEDEDAMEEAFATLENQHITLDISALPLMPAAGDTAVRLRLEQQLVHQQRPDQRM